MTGGVLGIQPHYDLLFLARPIGTYPVATHKRLVRQSLFFHRQVFLKFAAALWLRSRPFTSSQNNTKIKISPPAPFRMFFAGLSQVYRGSSAGKHHLEKVRLLRFPLFCRTLLYKPKEAA